MTCRVQRGTLIGQLATVTCDGDDCHGGHNGHRAVVQAPAQLSARATAKRRGWLVRRETMRDAAGEFVRNVYTDLCPACREPEDVLFALAGEHRPAAPRLF